MTLLVPSRWLTSWTLPPSPFFAVCSLGGRTRCGKLRKFREKAKDAAAAISGNIGVGSTEDGISTTHLVVNGIRGAVVSRNGMRLFVEVDLTSCRRVLVGDVVDRWYDLGRLFGHINLVGAYGGW